jgi:hypothetical protein
MTGKSGMVEEKRQGGLAENPKPLKYFGPNRPASFPLL